MVAYATVEQISAATDYKSTAYQTDTLRRLAASASRKIERRLHRHFYPKTETRTYTRPQITNPRSATSSGFFLNADLQSLTSVTADDKTITVSSVELYPSQHGPPFSWVGQTGLDVILVGVFGFSQDTDTAGALAAAVTDTTGVSVDVDDSSAIGIGDLIKVDTEQMDVTAKTQIDTTQNIGANLAADKAIVTVAVTTGTDYAVGEIILVNAERMLIVDISGNNLTVKRAWNGTVLAAHTSGDDVFAPRRLTVVRGAVGTTAATHLISATITRNVAPGPVIDLCIAETINTFEQESAGYGRVIGSGDNLREARGAGLADARREADRYQRLRMAAV